MWQSYKWKVYFYVDINKRDGLIMLKINYSAGGGGRAAAASAAASAAATKCRLWCLRQDYGVVLCVAHNLQPIN